MKKSLCVRKELQNIWEACIQLSWITFYGVEADPNRVIEWILFEMLSKEGPYSA